MEKLEHLKEINKQFSELEDTKIRLRSQIKDDQDGEKLIQAFQKEKERLVYERDEIVECLKLINNDITTIDQIIVQTENEAAKSLESIRRLTEEYRQRGIKLNKARTQISLPNLDTDDLLENLDVVNSKNGLANEWPTQQALREQMLNTSALSMLNKTVSKPLTSKSNMNFGHHHSDQNLPSLAERRTERGLSGTFLQQPPPMKVCMSCNQQIHRNAPICPYCKVGNHLIFFFIFFY